MSTNPHINSIFSEFQKTLDVEQETREAIRTICKDVDQVSREITTVLQVIHHNEESSSPSYIPLKIPRSCKSSVPPWWDNECEFAKLARKIIEKIYNNRMTEENFLNYKKFDALVKKLFEQKKLQSWRCFCASQSPVMQACLKARELLEKARDGYRKLKDTVPSTDYYKYQDHWRYTTQRYCFLISLVIWLEKGILAKHETVAEALGVSAVEEKCGFHLDVEDYLVGLLLLCTELSRLAVNSVTRGDYNRPVQISKFVMELNAGFRLLNLKNDHLRKRFDALKYDVKKIEEVVYDLSIRGLLPKTEEPVQG